MVLLTQPGRATESTGIQDATLDTEASRRKLDACGVPGPRRSGIGTADQARQGQMNATRLPKISFREQQYNIGTQRSSSLTNSAGWI
jgi:hypothetical protein